MALSRNVIEKRAIKAGIKASKKVGHVVTPAELMAVKIQTMPSPFRILLFTAGVLAGLSAWFAWPSESILVRGVEAISGVGLVAFGIFGIRKTLSHVVDSMDVLDLAGGVIELIGETISGFDL